jgi:ferrous iron transport protein B
MYRLRPITEEEKVAREILLQERPDVVIHVVDGKNLERMLPLTLQLIEAGLPVVLDINLMDEADKLGIQIDTAALQMALGVPVVATTLTNKHGLDNLIEAVRAEFSQRALRKLAPAPQPQIRYPVLIEEALAEIEPRLTADYQMHRRSIALLLMQDDPDIAESVQRQDPEAAAAILARVAQVQEAVAQPLSFIVAQSQRAAVTQFMSRVFSAPRTLVHGLAQKLSDAMMRPLTGLPILLVAMYGLYLFVGVLGAGTIVDFLEGSVFEAYINPWIDQVLLRYVPWPAIQTLIGGEYGVLTLGVRYAVALILPIVGTFFLAFSIIEDSGYLPRLAMLIDRVFKKIGLNGRAVIPMVLGLGCDTMATIVTRTLETRRERVISTLLLALAVPCSAQLGVMLGLLAVYPKLLVIWALVVLGIFLLVGYLAAKILPGERPRFYMELPPLRLPRLSNILVKTYTRMEWYFKEVFPLFIAASLLIWIGQLTGLFDLAVRALEPLVRMLGLPDDTAVAFLFGFFRRDYGAAGLYDMRDVMTGAQLLVATVTMTLFIPCIAQLAVAVKERGWKMALGMVAFIFPFAFAVGALLYGAINLLGLG